MRLVCLAILFATIIGAATFSCHTARIVPTTAPSARQIDLTPHLHGSLVFEDEDGAIVSLSLPALKQSIIRPASGHQPPNAFIHSVAGPDRKGRIAFVEGEVETKLYRLKLINMDGSNEHPLFQRAGDPIWDHFIGQYLAMSGDGQVAFISDLHGVQFPGAYLQEGMLQICDGSSGSVRTIAGAAIDQGISWFPDGKRIAFVARRPALAIARTEKPRDDWSIAASDDDNLVLVVAIFNIATRGLSIVHSGWLPVVATDGQSILISDMDRKSPDGTYTHHTWRFWISDGASQAVSAPELVGPFVALYADGTTIYQGRQTEDSPTYTKAYSPLSGERQLVSIKAGLLNSNGYTTLLRSFDSRNSISCSP